MNSRDRETGRDSSGVDPKDFVPVDSHVFYWLTRTINRRNMALARALAPLKCSVAQWRVMNILRQYQGISISELADRTAVDRTTLTRTVDGLESAGLLTRKSRPENGRVVALSLARRGHALYEKVLPVVRAQNAQALQGISAREAQVAIELMHKITSNLDGCAAEVAE